MDYRTAGVDIEAGERLVEQIKTFSRKTTRPGVMGSIGGFGALFDLSAVGLKDPILVSTTDGVGTKLRLAIETGRHGDIGIDLVAMCVNDLLVQGAAPLFFLDYFATGKLDLDVAKSVIAGIAEGCVTAGCSLVGGETAEMPGMYHGNDYDLAGFAVGAVERDAILPRDLAVGDRLIGIGSSGLHSNGYSLLRRVVADANLAWTDMASFSGTGRSLAEVFLAPTSIYVESVRPLIEFNAVQAMAHITGGGLPGNLVRVLPDGLMARITEPWPMHPEFQWIADLGGVPSDEMLRTFNCGIGMVLVVRPDDEAVVIAHLQSFGEVVFKLGELTAGQGVEICAHPLRD